MPVVILAVIVGVVVVTLRHRDGLPPPVPQAVGDGYGVPAVPLRWATAVALARGEGRRLLRHPAFLFGIAVTPGTLYLSTVADTEPVWWDVDVAMVLGIVPLGWLTIVAANLNALRERRHGTSELIEATPTPLPTRTLGHLISAWATVPVVLALVAGWTFVVSLDIDEPGTVRGAELGVAFLIVAGAVVVGVAVARYLPFPAFGFVAVIVVSVLQANLGDAEGSPLKFLAFLAPVTEAQSPVFEVRHAEWHVVYLLALTLGLGVVALLRHDRRRVSWAALAGLLAVMAVSGYAQTRPPGQGRVAVMVSYLADPGRHQVCERVDGVRYCTYPESAHRVPAWSPTVQKVLGAVPPDARRRRLEVSERFGTVVGNSNCSPVPYLTTVPDRVAQAVTPQGVWPRDGAVHPGTDTFPCGGRSSRGLFLGVQVGAWAVGLPPSPWYDDVRCHADGQARSVVALWLGAQAAPDAVRTLDDLLADEGARTEERFDFPAKLPGTDLGGWDDPPMWGVEWHVGDVKAARALLERPAQRVRDVLARDWDHLVRPATAASDLLDRVGVAVPARPEPEVGGKRACG